MNLKAANSLEKARGSTLDQLDKILFEFISESK